MAVVIDTPAVLSLIDPEDPRHKTVAVIFETNKCYMTPEAALWLYCLIYDHHGKATAEHWLQFVAAGNDIIIPNNISSDFDYIESAGYATLIARRLMHTGTSAALARKMQIPLVTSIENAKDLESNGFCKVILI